MKKQVIWRDGEMRGIGVHDVKFIKNKKLKKKVAVVMGSPHTRNPN